MDIQINEKVPLNKINYSVRAVQAVSQYGVGAMVDFPNQTLVTAAPEYWDKTFRIFDDRFARALNVSYFALPLAVSYARFPEWYFCPKCRKFQPLKMWIKEYQNRPNNRSLDRDKYMTSHLQCSTCHQDLVASRIVTVCEKGHLNDFPWLKWVHAKSKKPLCGSCSLKLKTGTSSSEGLEGIYLECPVCHASASLGGAFNKDVFYKMDDDGRNEEFLCEGNHPFSHERHNCGCYPRTVQRGASSVYFPLVYSSMVIPPYANEINIKVEKSKAYEECVVIIEDEDPEDRKDLVERKLNKWTTKIANEIGALEKDVKEVLISKWLKEDTESPDVGSVQYRFDEYAALSENVTLPDTSLGDFSKEIVPVEEYKLPYIKTISLVDKVRVVNAFVGFSRLNPVVSAKDKGFVSAKKPDTNWYPAYEVRGEGIFVEFNQEDIDSWIARNPEVVERAEMLNTHYAESFNALNHPRNITPKFILLHTISHLLIQQLSFECGYSVASLSERIYCSDKTDGKNMSGIFIYTASGDAEGTLGGLVRQGRPDAFPTIFKKAINHAEMCSNDPVCIMSHGQGRDGLNLAACHACTLLPETCCEEFNCFLDRGMITGTYENKNIGFYSNAF